MVTISTYQGNPTISLPLLGSRYNFTFGLRKAKAIKYYYEEILTFIVEHDPSPVPDVPFSIPDLEDYLPRQESLAQWIAKTGGVRDSSLTEEIKGLVTDVGKAHKKAKAIPPGFLNNKRGRGLDEIVTEANNCGWQIEDESHLLELLEQEQKKAYNL